MMENLHLVARKYFENKRGDIPSNFLKEIEERAESRRKAGRYTLEEAAVFAQIHAGANAASICNALAADAAREKLNIYHPGQNSKRRNLITSQSWCDEAYWNELNVWFINNEPRIGPIFPNPDKGIESGLKRREKQIRAIEKLADELDYPRMSIPQGGKAEMLKLCLGKHPELFGGEHPFKDAWKDASTTGRIQIKDKEKYMS